MTKEELKQWIDEIPDDIFQNTYAIDPWGKMVQAEFNGKIIKTYFPGETITFDTNGYIALDADFGRLILT